MFLKGLYISTAQGAWIVCCKRGAVGQKRTLHITCLQPRYMIDQTPEKGGEEPFTPTINAPAFNLEVKVHSLIMRMDCIQNHFFDNGF